MNKKKTVRLTILLLLFLLLTGVYLVLKTHNQKAEKLEEESAAGDMIYQIEEEEIARLSFQIENQEAVFEKEKDDWMYQKDEHFPVNKEKMSTLTNTVKALTANRKIEKVDDITQYGLDQPVNTIQIQDKDGKTTKFTVGMTNESTGDCYVYLDDNQKTVYTVTGDLSTLFSGSLMNYAQEESYPTISSDHITEISINKGNTQNVYKESKTSEEKWTMMKTAVTGLTYHDFVEYYCADPGQYGLEEPYAVITVKYKEDSKEKEMILSIGNEDGNGNQYVSVEGSDQIHSISTDSLSELLK